MTKIHILLLLIISISFPTVQAAQKEDVEKLRIETMKKWGKDGLIKPYDVRKSAKKIFSKSEKNQSIKELKNLAKTANTAANLVGFILDEYVDYYRDNYKYDFVQTKVAPFHDKYVGLSNELKEYRNKAYFIIGKKLKSKGKNIEAIFYFRDVYRLSTFTEEEGDHKGTRYKAEQELKSLLGLNDINSFIYWK